MSTMMTTIKKWQDGYLNLIKRTEEPVVRVTGDVSESMVRFVPERPAFMAEMPTVTELVDSQLRFRKRIVDEQAAFVRKMLKAMDPMLVKFEATPRRVAHAPTAPVARMAPRCTPRQVA